MNKSNHISYVEFKAKDLAEIKIFYQKTFGWKFKDYSDKYTAFFNSGIAGGFEKSTDKIINGALVVLYHTDLQKIKDRVCKFNGRISKEIFSFPGGQRFQFIDPAGNELAVWSANE